MARTSSGGVVSKEIKQVLAIAAGAVVIVLGVMTLMGGSVTTEVHPPVDLPDPGELGPAGTPAAVVVDLRQEQETSFFGLRKGETRYVVGVQFYGPSACTGLITDDAAWPLPDLECSTEVPITGVATGVGIAATGEAVIVVYTDVPTECFDAINRGDWWPSDAPECDS
jgi:hypothetical protein